MNTNLTNLKNSTHSLRGGNTRFLALGAVSLGAALVALASITVWRGQTSVPTLPTALARYTPEGYGGYTGVAPKAVSATTKNPKAASAIMTTASVAAAPRAATLEGALGAYRQGRYEESESLAKQVLETTPVAKITGASETRLKARRLTGFALARRGQMAGAREQFAQLAREAAAVKPDLTTKNNTSKATLTLPQGGWQTPGMTEDALYQHAVCTLALGDKAGAEREWIALIKAHPESPLVPASVKRIARLHGGDIPQEADQAWKQAMATARARENERQRQASLCGPQTLAEVLRRRGDTVSVETLAKQMHTSETGTSLADLGQVARRNGFAQADGFALTSRGLQVKRTEVGKHGAVIALVNGAGSGHFVLVEAISSNGDLTVWDSNGAGLNHPQARTYMADEWRQVWQGAGKTGMALVIQ